MSTAPRMSARTRWWLAVIGCLLACVGLVLWFGRNILPVRVVHPGQSYTDPWGTRFTVVDRQVLEVPDNLDAPEGTVLVRYEVSVEDFAIDEDLGESYDPGDVSTIASSSCFFDLVGDEGQHWSADARAREPGEQVSCDFESRPVIRSQRVVQYYVVPAERVDHLVGLSGDALHRSKRFPVIR